MKRRRPMLVATTVDHVYDELGTETVPEDPEVEGMTPPRGEQQALKPDAAKDRANILLLLLLYSLQGVPMGLSASVPLVLQQRQISYAEQSLFSLVSWPFSLKLLWAPIVDSVFSAQMGRRKSWLIPAQLVIACIMGAVGWFGADLLGEEAGSAPQVSVLTVLFFVLYFAAATQDIAVDGWALTMLRSENVGYASVCNSAGQSIGYFLAYVVFLVLNSAEFSDSYLRSEPTGQSMVSFGGFLLFWAVVFVVTTVAVWVWKPEKEYISNGYHPLPSSDDEYGARDVPMVKVSKRRSSLPRNRLHTEDNALHTTTNQTDADADQENVLVAAPQSAPLSTWQRLYSAYGVMWDIIRRPPVLTLCLLQLLWKIPSAPTDSVAQLRLLDKGFPREHLAFIGLAFVPLNIALPLVLAKFTAGTGSLDRAVRWAYPARIAVGLTIGWLVWSLPEPSLAAPGVSLDWTLYFKVIVLVVIQSVVVNAMFVSQMSFFSRVADPEHGGTYITLLNTCANLGSKWPSTLSLWAVGSLTQSHCLGVESVASCGPTCAERGGVCAVANDGYITVLLCASVVGVLMFPLFTWLVKQLKGVPRHVWWGRKNVKQPTDK